VGGPGVFEVGVFVGGCLVFFSVCFGFVHYFAVLRGDSSHSSRYSELFLQRYDFQSLNFMALPIPLAFVLRQALLESLFNAQGSGMCKTAAKFSRPRSQGSELQDFLWTHDILFRDCDPPSPF